MITLRPAADRGHSDLGWLDSRHTFSFSEYHDPDHMGFAALRVMNEDRVAPGAGFGTHPHQDMEIISYVLEGTMAHRDSMGHVELLRAGELQRMSAGTGLTHSEYNASEKDPLHFYQVWILPDRKGHTPGYEQKLFDPAGRKNRWQLIVRPVNAGVTETNGASPLTIHQDAQLWLADLITTQDATYFLFENENGVILWLWHPSGNLIYLTEVTPSWRRSFRAKTFACANGDLLISFSDYSPEHNDQPPIGRLYRFNAQTKTIGIMPIVNSPNERELTTPIYQIENKIYSIIAKDGQGGELYSGYADLDSNLVYKGYPLFNQNYGTYLHFIANRIHHFDHWFYFYNECCLYKMDQYNLELHEIETGLNIPDGYYANGFSYAFTSFENSLFFTSDAKLHVLEYGTDRQYQILLDFKQHSITADQLFVTDKQDRLYMVHSAKNSVRFWNSYR